MEIFQAAILGIIQGLTEFLPISSSGHLVLVPSFFGWARVLSSLEFSVAVHVGTALAVVWFFWEDWVRIVRSFLRNIGKGVTADFDSRLLILIVVGSIPAAILGLTFKDFIEENTREPALVATTLFIFALVLFFADKFGKKKRGFSQIGWLDAVFVGTAQALALVPGVSRSGITISAGLFSGLNRVDATRFSFLLSTPAIVGAAVLTAKDAVSTSSEGNLLVFIVGTLSAAVAGWLTIKFLLQFVATHTFNIFVWYRIVLAVLVMLLNLNLIVF